MFLKRSALADPKVRKRDGTRVIGIPWYTPETYAVRVDVNSDRKKDGSEYASWLSYAEEVAERINAAGAIAVKVVIVPEDFHMGCRVKSLIPDAPAHFAFAASLAVTTA